MFYMAFFLMLEEGKTPTLLLVGIGAMLGITIAGLGLTVWANRGRSDRD